MARPDAPGRQLAFSNCWLDGVTSYLTPIVTGWSAANARASGIIYLKRNGSTIGSLGPDSGISWINGDIDALTCYT